MDPDIGRDLRPHVNRHRGVLLSYAKIGNAGGARRGGCSTGAAEGAVKISK